MLQCLCPIFAGIRFYKQRGAYLKHIDLFQGIEPPIYSGAGRFSTLRPLSGG